MCGGVRNPVEAAEAISVEGHDGSVSSRIEDVDCAVMFCDSDWEGATGRLLIDENWQTIEEMKAGDSAAARVDSEQQVAIFA
jgi:hypothetical protein